MTAIAKKLDHLHAVSNCIDTKQILKDQPLLTKVLRVLKIPFHTTQVYVKRTYYLMVYREWNNNKSAAKVVRHYLFNSDSQQQKPERFQKIEGIFRKLQPMAEHKNIKLQWIDQSWTKDHKTDSLHKFHKVKKMPEIASKMLFHLHGDSFGKNNNSLEGSSLNDTLEYLSTYLHQRKAQGAPVAGVSDVILEQIKNAAELAQDFNKNATPLITKAFEQNKRLLIPGGWTGSPSGHALCYELIPGSSESATLRLFNLGAGASNHFNAIVGNKFKSLPYLELVGVSKEALLDKNTLLSLNELLTHAFIPNAAHKKTEYNETDIYEGLKALLKPKNISQGEGSPAPESLKTLQRAGICSLRSPMAFLATCMPKADYKRLVCDIRLQSLCDRVKQCGRKRLSKSEWHLLQKSQQNLSRKLAKALETSLIGKQYAFKSCFELKKISAWLNTKKEESFSLPIPPSETPWHWVSYSFKKEATLVDKPLHTLETDVNVFETLQPYSHVYHQIDTLIDQDLKTAVPALLKIANAAKDANEHHAFHVGLIDFIAKSSSFDVNKAINGLDETDSEKLLAEKHRLITDLGKIAEIFFETCLRVPESTIIHPERHHTLLKILFIQQKLSDQQVKLTLKGLTGDKFFFKIRDANMQEAFEKSTKTFGINSAFYSLHKKSEIGENSSLCFLQHRDNTQKGLQNLFPEVMAALSAKNPAFKSFGESMQNAHIYASEELPDWFKGIRNTHLYLLALSNEPILNPPTPKIDCSFQFNIREVDTDATKLFFSVKGITADMLNYYPTVKRVLNQPKYRYKNLFRPIQDPHLKKIIEILISSKASDEKKLLADHISEHVAGVPDELYKVLAHIFLAKNLQIAESYAYFVKNPAKLCNLDYQVLFEILFFQGNLLKTEMGAKGFAENLGNFLLKQYQHASEKNEIQASVFLLKMLRLCGEYAPAHPQFMGTLAKLRGLLSQNGLSVEEKSVIHAEIVSTLAKKKPLDAFDLQDLLSGTCHLKKNPVPAKWMCPETNKNVRNALHIHAKEIEKILKHPSGAAILSQLTQEILGTQMTQWQLVEKPGQFPYFTSNGPPLAHYYPLHAEFARENEKTRLPLEISDHPHIKQLFGEIHSGILKTNEIYELNSLANERTLVKYENNQVIIEQLRNGTWYRFIPRETFLPPYDYCSLSSKHLALNFQHWQPLNNDSIIEIVNPQTQRTEYQVNLVDDSIVSITRISDGAKLGSPSALFTHFEHPTYIHEWYLGNHLKQVELPRYGLTFNSDPKQQRLFSQEIPGFFLSQKQYVPFLGAFNHYLVLENAQGQKKVILPHHHFEGIASTDMESLEPKYKINQNLSPACPYKQNFMIFDTSQEGHLKAHSKKANLFLSYILTGAGEYAQAATYLKKYGTKLSAYTEEEKALLMKLATLDQMTGDMDGNAIALRLYARYLLLKNCVDHNQTIPIAIASNLSAQLNLYLARYHHATELKLNKYEEGFLLKFALKTQYDTRQFIRLNELDPSFAKAYVPPPQKMQQDKHENFAHSFKNSLKTPRVHNGSETPLDVTKALITRIDHYIETNFNDIYRIAIGGTAEEKKWLHDALTFSKQTKGISERILIECVLKNSSNFPAYLDTESDYSTRNAWWDKVLSTADLFAKDLLQPFLQKKAPQLDIPNLTPADFRLDPIHDDSPPVNIVYRIPLMKPFKEACKRSKCFITTKVSEENGDEFTKWLQHEIDHPICPEPLYKKKFEQFKAEKANPTQPQVTKRYALTKNGMRTLEKMLNPCQKTNTHLKDLQVEILELANRRSSQGRENVLQQLQEGAKQLKLFTLDDLLVCFAKKDPANLLKRNPALDEKSAQVLFARLGEFLALQTHEHQRQRASLLLQEVKRCQKASDKEELTQQLASALLDKRRYDPQQNPAYLVFEYYANIYLRTPQVNRLAQFLKDGDQNPIIEMIMGSGKSKVLLPLLALLRADGEAISMIVVPQALFESVSSDTQEILDEAFALPLRSLHFDRNTLFSTHSLRTILDDLNRIQKERESLIITSKSLECFILKFVEKCSIHLPRGEFPEELQLMQQILLKLEKAIPFIDEADSVLNVLHEVCFSLGNKRQLVPSEVQTLSLLFNLLYTDPELKALAQLDSDPHANSKAPIFTEELYHKEIKHKLAEKFLAQLGNELFEPAVTANVHHFLKGLSAHNKNLALNYLSHNAANLSEAQAFFNQQHDDVKNILALAAEEISSFLPHTLAKNFNKKYGLDPKSQSPISIPYAAANTPNTGSQFANAYVTMNYTFQTYMKAGVTKEIILHEISRLQSEAMNELKENPGLTLENTKAWQTFCKLKGELAVPLFNQKEVHVDQIVNRVNSSEKQKSFFVANIILPQLEIFGHKTCCNPHNIIAFFKKKLTGSTGTLWNDKSMHRKLHPEPEPGIDIKTINILRKHSLHEVYMIKESSTEEMLSQLNAQQIFYELIGDAGGYFKEGGNAQIAKTMAQKNGKPVVFYNAKNAQTETDGVHEIPLSESKTPLDKRQTFLDQNHTTGADVPQKVGAVGIITIDGNMLLRDLLQAVWRLRGLETKGQRIKFVLTQEVESIILQKLRITRKPTFDDILRFTVINQVHQQGKDNFKALRQELDCTIQFLLLDLLLSDTFSLPEKKQAFLYLENTWLKEENMAPKDLYGTICHEEDSALVRQDLKVKFLNKVDAIFTELPFLTLKGINKEQTLEEVNQICKKYEESLAAKVFVPIRDMDSDQTVETEQETAMQTETELEVQEQKQTEKVTLGLHESTANKFYFTKIDEALLKDKSTPKIPCVQLQDYCKTDPILKEYIDAFKGIYLALNVFEWPSKNPCVADLKLWGNHRTPFHFVKVQEDDTVIILSQHEAKHGKGTKKKDETFADQMYHLTFGFYDESKPVSDELLEKIVKVEFLNGESSYSKKKQEILKKWFQEQGAEKMRTLFQQHILAGYPEKTAAYSNSHLQNIFKEAGTAA